MDEIVSRCNRLLKRIQGGSRKALEELFEEFGPLFLNMAKKYLFDKGLAGDLIGEVFLDIVKSSAKSFDESKNGLNWIFTIIRRKAYKFNGGDDIAIDIDDYDKTLAFYMIDYSDLSQDRAVDIALLKDAMNTLSKEENEILYLKYWECLTVREIAQKLNIPRSSIQYKIKTILDKLKKYIGD